MAKESEEINYIVRVAGTDLDGSKTVQRAIQKVKGVGPVISNAVVGQLGYGKKLLGKLSEKEVEKLEESLKNPTSLGVPGHLVNRQKDPETGKNLHVVGVDLLMNQKGDIEFQKKIKTRRGFRHGKGLKVRGQRTKSTGRSGTTVGVVRKKIKQKMKKKKEGESK